MAQPEIWIRASGPPTRLEFPGGEKFGIGSAPVRFTGDLVPLVRAALRHCHGIEEWKAPVAEPIAVVKKPAAPEKVKV